MAYNLPTFNLLGRIWWQTNVNLPADRDNVPVQLYYPKPTALQVAAGNATGPQVLIYSRWPKGTRLWGWRGGNLQNRVEIPRLSQRYYDVLHVESVHMGFPNEYLSALLLIGTAFPVPAIMPFLETDDASSPDSK